MTEKIYEKLRQFLDQITPMGFPATSGGAEQKLMEIYFTPEAAKAITYLSIHPEPVEVISARMGENAHFKNITIKIHSSS